MVLKKKHRKTVRDQIKSDFSGMFENPALAVKTSCKRNINFLRKTKIFWNINYKRMSQKIDDIIGWN